MLRFSLYEAERGEGEKKGAGWKRLKYVTHIIHRETFIAALPWTTHHLILAKYRKREEIGAGIHLYGAYTR